MATTAERHEPSAENVRLRAALDAGHLAHAATERERAALRVENARLRSERDVAAERHIATTDGLRVIARGPADASGSTSRRWRKGTSGR